MITGRCLGLIFSFLPEFGVSLPKGPDIIKPLVVILAEREADLPSHLIALIE